jgi:hypothetical protein
MDEGLSFREFSREGLDSRLERNGLAKQREGEEVKRER